MRNPEKNKAKKLKKLRRRFWTFVILLNAFIIIGLIYFLVLLFRVLRS